MRVLRAIGKTWFKVELVGNTAILAFTAGAMIARLAGLGQLDITRVFGL